MNSIEAIAGQPQLDVDAIGGAVELGHVAPGDDQRVAVGPSEDAAPLRGIEVVEDRRDARRPGEEPRDVPIGAGVILADERDVAVGIEKRFAVSPGVVRKRERQRDPRARIVAQRNLVADAAQKRAVEGRTS